MSQKREKQNRKIEAETMRITRKGTMEPRIIAAVHGMNKKEAFNALVSLVLYVENLPDDFEGPVIKAILAQDLEEENGTT